MDAGFQALLDKDRARMAVLHAAFERDGCLLAVSARDPFYSILLSRNPSSDVPWRVTSFRSGEPLGHREYDRLDGGSPIQTAFQEFASNDMVPTSPPRRRTPSAARVPT
jgi:hypothetical protein